MDPGSPLSSIHSEDSAAAERRLWEAPGMPVAQGAGPEGQSSAQQDPVCATTNVQQQDKEEEERKRQAKERQDSIQAAIKTMIRPRNTNKNVSVQSSDTDDRCHLMHLP